MIRIRNVSFLCCLGSKYIFLHLLQVRNNCVGSAVNLIRIRERIFVGFGRIRIWFPNTSLLCMSGKKPSGTD
jgi:hypothetical protein